MKDLLQKGVLKTAKLPADQEMSGSQAIFLIDHDYPARTPALWNHVYRSIGWQKRAIMMVADPEKTVGILEVFAKDPDYIGGGLGVGFKDEAVKQKALDDLDPLAQIAGAANVIAKENGRLIGHNTDGIGYWRGLREKLEELGKNPSDCKILLLGAGGTANAIAAALINSVARLVILNRTPEKAAVLAKRLDDHARKSGESRTVIIAGGESEISEYAVDSDIIINTSVKGATGRWEKFAALAGTSSLEENLSQSEEILFSLKSDALISDVNLTQGDPTTIALAKRLGLPTQDGRPMVLYQGVEAFWIVNREKLAAQNIAKSRIASLMREVISF